MSAEPLETVIHWQQNRALRRFLIGAVLVLSWVAVDVGIWFATYENWLPVERQTANRLRLGTAYLLPLFAAATVWLLDQVSRQGVAFQSRIAATSGVLFILCGAGFDLCVTLFHSPDLAMEGNPYIRALLDSRHSLGFVYLYGSLTQIWFIGLFCAVWLGFLRHARILADSIRAARPRTWLEFLKAATGGGHLTHRQWLLPITPQEVPLLYHSMWATAIAVVFGITLFRWYAGLEWLGVVEPTITLRIGIILTGVMGSLALYFLGLWRLCVQEPLAAIPFSDATPTGEQVLGATASANVP